MDASVLVVGAGPTGLVLALWLARLGVRFRIVDRQSGPGQASRAMAVQARTLEYYRQLGFADEVVRRGITMDRIRLRESGREIAAFRLGDFGAGLSPFPFVLSFPQDDHEHLLTELLAAAGVHVEWNTEVLGFDDDGARVRVRLRANGGDEACDVAYLCGCDGVHSVVRHGAGLGFPGGTYDQAFYVADVDTSRDPADTSLTLCLASRLFCGLMPVRSSGMQRLIGIVPPELGNLAGVGFEDIRPLAERLTGLRVARVNWFSTYHVHHRVADHFRHGRAFIAGDAGHVHSPAGGQGMNTGIGDAVNLAWKLADVLHGRADTALLDTYEPERIAFARLLVATTDTVFRGMVDQSRFGRVLRTRLLPTLLPLALRLGAVRRAMFRLVSQTRVHYRDSPLSAGDAGEVRGGDRLPWVNGPRGSNFDPLRTLEWQVHVYGTATDELRTAVRRRDLALHEFDWSGQMQAAGLARDAAYVVRPDGYVALATPTQDTAQLAAYLGRWGIGARSESGLLARDAASPVETSPR